MKAILSLLGLALVSVTGALVYELGRKSAAKVASRPPAVAEVQTVAVAPAPDVRAQIRQVVKSDVAKLTTEREVDGYLDQLTARARKNRQVSALEVEPGIQAIRQLAGQIGVERSQEKVMAFSEMMAKLSASFEPVVPRVDLEELGRRIDRSSGDERSALIRRYDEATRALPPDERLAQAERLNRWAAPQ